LLPVAIITGRELVISVYRILVGSKGVSVPASKVAKYKTVCQQLAVGVALWPWFAVDHRWLWNGLLWIAVGLALVSGWNYLSASRRQRVPDAV
jgi:CDP-diacylglycerol--glycerol-3-phosphate 3-phosphatidyltransferase